MRDQIIDALSTIKEPETGKDIVRLGMVRGLTMEEGRVAFTVIVKNPGTPFADGLAEACRAALHEHASADLDVDVTVDNEMIGLGADVQVSGGNQKPSAQPQGVRNFIAVASGKGGVGKSTVAANLAVGLAQEGYDVGLVDVDIYGPSVPTMFGVHDEKPRVNEQRKILPIERHGVKLLSMGFLVEPEKAVIWRGPMVSNAVRQFLGDAAWGDLDFLVLDLPPGTGDIQLTLVQTISLTGSVIVSTPQEVALADARKGVAMFGNVNVPVLGIVENMSYFTPHDMPDRKYDIFGRGGARRLANEVQVPFLGEIPIEEAVRTTSDEGTPIVVKDPEAPSAKAFRELARSTARQVFLRNAMQPATQSVEILYK